MHTKLLALPHSFRERLQALAVPFLLFSAALAILLLLSSLFLLPRLTRIAVQGMLLQPEDVAAYAQQVEEDIATLERDRDETMLPIHDPLFLALRAQLQPSLSVANVRDALRAAAAQVPDAREAVVFSSIAVDIQQAQVELAGDVRGVGPRSGTVLAAFLDALRTNPFVADVGPVPLQRVDDPVIGPHTPFTVTILLNHAPLP